MQVDLRVGRRQARPLGESQREGRRRREAWESTHPGGGHASGRKLTCAGPGAPPPALVYASAAVGTRPSLRVAFPVGLVAGSALALQVLLTRLLAAELDYQFGFLAISLALLGTGAGAILVYLRPGWFEATDIKSVLARWCMVLSGLLLAAPFLLVRIRFSTSSAVTGHFVVAMAGVCVLAVLPFTAAGIVIALAVRAGTAWLSRLYAADLTGAAIGAIAVVPLMWTVTVPSLLVALGGVAALAAVVLASGTQRIASGGVLAISVVAIALAGWTHLYYMPPTTTAPSGMRLVADRWDPLNRVVAYAPSSPSARFALLFYDRVYAPVPVHKPGTPLPNWRTLDLGPQSIGYAMTGHGRRW